MNRFFITGGAGVIGLEIVAKLLQRGCAVLVGDLKPRPSAFDARVQYRCGDLNDLTVAELTAFNPEAIIHLAATFERSTETAGFWNENFRHNVQLSHHVMSLARHAPALQRVIFASSYLIYDPALYQHDASIAQPRSLSETDPILPRNLTGMAKLSHEIELRFLAQQEQTHFSSSCARIFRGYGCNSRDVISRWIRALLADDPIEVYNPEGWFDYIYARDTAEGLIRLTFAGTVTGVVNLGTGRSRRVADVLDVLRKHFPAMRTIERDPEPPIESSQADMTLWRQAIGWLPEIDLEESIVEIIEHERSQIFGDTAARLEEPCVLVTSAAAKVPLLRAVQQAAAKLNSCIKVWAGDSNEDALTRYIAEAFWCMPVLGKDSLEAVLSGCHERNITTILPTRDGELEFWATHREVLQEAGIHVVISPLASVQRCLDKLAFARFGLANAMPFIPAESSIDALNSAGYGPSSYTVKERFGAGSLSIGLALNQALATTHALHLAAPIFQPYVTGREISVDAWLDSRGVPKGVVMRHRDKVVNGESQVTTTFRDARLEAELRGILVALDLRGPVVLQALVDDSGQLHVIECNSRFGGASTASVAVGLDSFYWSLLEASGASVDSVPFERIEEELRQVRLPYDEHCHDTGI